MSFDFQTLADAIDYGFGTGFRPDYTVMAGAQLHVKTAPCIIDALTRFSQSGLYGWTDSDDPLYIRAVVNWMAKVRGWEIEPSWIVPSYGILQAMCASIRAFTQPGGKVLMQTPIYPPFTELTKANGRVCSMNPLKFVNGRYDVDFEDFERRAADPDCSLFLLCSPHNPTGRVFSADELNRFVEICAAHDVVILSDEVHSGFVFKGEHAFLPRLSETAARISVWGSSPSKTFNTAGLRAASLGSKNPELNAKLKAELTASQPDRSIFSQTAFAAAWTECDDYGEQVAAYVKKNLEFAVEFFRTRIPSIKTYLPDATYLMWLDCSALGFKTQTELSEFFVKEAKVALNPGESFGPGGEQHMRLNTACPRSTLETALQRIEAAAARRCALLG